MPSPQAQVHILEAIAEIFVKEAHLHEHLGEDEEAGAGDHMEFPGLVDCGMAPVKIAVEMVNFALLVENHAGMLHQVVRVEELGAHHGQIVILCHRFHEGVEPAIGHQGVVVEHDEVVAPGGPGPLVAGLA